MALFFRGFPPFAKVIVASIALSFLYALVVTFRLAIGTPSLIDVVDSCKLASLAMVLIVNGHIAHGIDRNQGIVVFFNYVVLFFTLIATIFLALKIFGIGTTPPSMDAEWIEAKFYFLQKNLVFFTAIPIVGYSLIDLFISLFGAKNFRGDTEDIRKDRGNEKRMARNFFVYADLPALLPLALAMIFILGRFTHFDQYDRDLFLSGAMAIIILSSSICSLAVQMYNE
ncbi:MAG: hypothetical protein KUG74_15320 [Rhodobacteraceae bacterium]|nr:hypothetical protein [Paracoccaceae bacterium]